MRILSTGKIQTLGLALVIVVLISAAAVGGSDESTRSNHNSDQGRIGVAILDVDGKSRNVLHGDERFAMCSTFKFLALAGVMHSVDCGEDKLDRFVKYGQSDILTWAPVTKQHLREGGMSLESLCFAAVAYSDNTAGNLLLRTLGGPAGLTAYVRSLGDNVTRFDRTEPDLNNVVAGDARDTTTPMAMLRDMQKVLLGNTLSAPAREKLQSWMVQNTTGDAMIRAAVPKEWRVGDKTGGNETGNSNDIGIIWRPDGRLILLSIYVDFPGEPVNRRAKMIADVTRELIAP